MLSGLGGVGDMPEINFDEVVEPAIVGVNRAVVFMGLGVTAASESAVANYRLPEAPHIDLIPQVTEEQLAEFKREFGVWIIGNGLRELVETWDVFLDRLYIVSLASDEWRAERAGEALRPGQYAKRARAFPKRGTGEKFDLLQTEFGIRLTFEAEIESIKKARNCLTHRLGVVGAKDLNSPGGLAVRWRAPELFGYHEDGSEFVPSLDAFPIEFPTGSPVKLRHGERQKIVPRGHRLQLSAAELKEICYTFRIAIMQAQESFAGSIARIGGTVNQPAKSSHGVGTGRET